jgi:hypothetical protein
VLQQLQDEDVNKLIQIILKGSGIMGTSYNAIKFAIDNIYRRTIIDLLITMYNQPSKLLSYNALPSYS